MPYYCLLSCSPFLFTTTLWQSPTVGVALERSQLEGAGFTATLTSPEDYEITVNPFPLHVTFSEEVMELDESAILVGHCHSFHLDIKWTRRFAYPRISHSIRHGSVSPDIRASLRYTLQVHHFSGWKADPRYSLALLQLQRSRHCRRGSIQTRLHRSQGRKSQSFLS